MGTEGSWTGLSAEFWKRIDDRIRQFLGQEIEERLRNRRPGGSATISMGAGAPGAPLLASATAEWCHVTIDFPFYLDRVEARTGPPGGTAVFDIRVARPGQSLAAAASIVGTTFPTLSGREYSTPAAADWVRMIEAGSTVVLLVTDATIIEDVTVNLIGRCV